MKKITINISPETIKMIEELKKHELLKKWEPNTSDIIRVAIANYWEDMIMENNSLNKSLTNS